MRNKKDVAIVRELAARVAEIAARPAQEKTRALWRKLNARRPDRPMVMIDQVCWNEIKFGDEMVLRAADPECRNYEGQLRRLLCQWNHFRVDMVVEPFVRVPKAIQNTGFGIRVEEDIAVTDPTNSVVGHKFVNQFETEDDLQKIRMPGSATTRPRRPAAWQWPASCLTACWRSGRGAWSPICRCGIPSARGWAWRVRSMPSPTALTSCTAWSAA